ncbi:MAG: glutamate--tRNA ligase [Candidatus Pacebacteria bacterium]|nr:glutamate--tRNA ligase [Candidatus Paceibacterota bacterium]
MQIIERLFPNLEITPEEVENKYPPRDLEASAKVTRVAPSPTGFMHIGGIFAGLLSERLAHQSGGVFFVRIEDTDKKREVEGAVQLIIDSLSRFNIPVDEGETLAGEEKGNYGPYRQSKRENIYKTFARKLVQECRAYPCFCTVEELKEITSQQEKNKSKIGYYGDWAKWRDKSDEDVLKALDEGKPFVIRFKSSGSCERRMEFEDMVKGKLSMPENYNDIVIIKSDGLPTYHFAHVVDDHFMGSTDVVRGEEWLSSVPLHIELFRSLGWESPRYGHFPTIQKLEGHSKRKLSKRKDPEANVLFYNEEGYSPIAVTEYLLNLIDSDFEDWRKQNPQADNRDFPIRLEHLAGSAGPLLDIVKLQDINKDYISKLSAEEVLEQCITWAEKYDEDLLRRLKENPDYSKRIFSIERGGELPPRKDIAKWSDARRQIEYFFDGIFEAANIDFKKLLPGMTKAEIKRVAEKFLSVYDEQDDKITWFSKVKDVARSLGYADSAKAFKKEKDKYKGHVGDVAMVARVLLTGRTQAPELFEVMHCMGTDRVRKRLKNI